MSAYRFVATAFCATCGSDQEISLRAGRSAAPDLGRLSDPAYRATLTRHPAGRCTRCGSSAIDDSRMTIQILQGETIAC
jgi:hypothetical protein